MKRCLAAWLLFAAVAPSQELSIHQASPEIVEQRLRAYARKNSEREPAIRRLFEEAGCKGDSLREETAKGVKGPNLICTQAGSTDRTIVVGAHFDLAEIGHGVVDNWTGAAILPTLYQGLASTPRKHNFVYVAFADEERGLLGSKAYVKQLGDARARITAMVNMDSLGLSDTKVWANHSDKDLVRWLFGVANAIKMPLAVVNVDKIGETDSESFRARRIPAITIHSVTQETLKILHSPLDRIEAVHLDEYYRTYQLVLAYLAVLDQKLD